MREQPMTKMFKCLAVTLTAVILAAVLANAPAGATHDPKLIASVVSIEGGESFSNDGGLTWTATAAEYVVGEADAGGDNGDGPHAGTFRCCRYRHEFSNDGGLTWTATLAEYIAGEYHDAGGDNGDGPHAGTFRRRNSGLAFFSNDGGLTWSALRSDYVIGEADAGGDNGDGPNAGTFRARSTWLEYSFDGGSTWTEWSPTPHTNSLNPQYLAGEADAGGDNGDGPNAGTFRFRISTKPLLEVTCLIITRDPGVPGGQTYPSERGTSWPSLQSFPCSPKSTQTYTWNVDDGIEPTGDWCVTGRALADGRSMICRGEGYTYREARRELGFGLGRP